VLVVIVNRMVETKVIQPATKQSWGADSSEWLGTTGLRARTLSFKSLDPSLSSLADLGLDLQGKNIPSEYCVDGYIGERTFGQIV
jgi:hypothetical protein